MNSLLVGVVAVACALCAYAAPPEVRAFEADVRIESNIMPVGMDSHCYWDIDQQKYRVDTEMWGMKNIDISDFNASMRYIIDESFGQTKCRRCFLDEDMNPMTVPPIALPDGTDVVNGETCDVWRLKFPLVLDWTFCTQQHEPYAVLRTVMNALGVKTTMTFKNILVYHPPAAVFQTNSTECQPPQCDAPVDVALLIDGSGSISSSDFSLMKKFSTLIASNMTISEKSVNMAAIQFSSGVNVEFPLTSDRNTVLNGISRMSQLGSSTNMDAGLDKVLSVLTSSKRSVSQVCIMFTDGEPDSGNDPVAHAQNLKDHNIEIYTVGVGSGVNPKLLKAIATEDRNPLQPHYFQASSFQQLMELLSNIVSAACKDDTCSTAQ